ncbi:MAG TPA: hypothetical protein VJK05_02405 [archaeon]|nr:hypothetical protein [archaeon]
MKKKIFLISLIFMILFSSLAFSLSLNQNIISVSIGKDGSASFIENYFLRLSELEKEELKKNLEANGKDLIKWQDSYDFFFPHFSEKNELTSINIVFDEANQVLQLAYASNRPFAQKEREEARFSQWVVPDSIFRKFITGTTIVIPENTLIALTLPDEGYFNRDELRSEIKIEGDSLKIIGFQGSGLRITYNVDKPIARFNTNEFIQTFFDSPLTQTVAAIILVALIALFFNREKVSKKIENFIVEHSELEQFEEEEL